MMEQRIYCMGAVKLFKHLKDYRAVVGRGSPIRTRLLKRKFRTCTYAKNYGKRFVNKWNLLHREV